MHYTEFTCSPSAADLFALTRGMEGRVLIEDVGRGTALLCASPVLTLTAKDGVVEVTGGSRREQVSSDPLTILDEYLARFARAESGPELPFAGGAVGWFSYDLGRSIERMPSIAVEDVPTPDYCLGFCDSGLWIDAPGRRCVAVSWSGDRRAVEDWRRLALSAPEATVVPEARAVHCPGGVQGLNSNFSREGYLDAIRAVQDYIARGDVYQVNLSQRFDAQAPSTPWELYRALRRVNPAPKSCYMELSELALASASPELLLSYDPATRLARTRPIKGTRPRGRDLREDEALARELASSGKDRAENLMIVDMERNDLGRVARYGSVRVPELWGIEPHPNVFQMVSTVEAKLESRYGPVDLLRACFPGGSITGAPKVRAMEIIEELEPHRRGLYTGSAGYIDFRGRVDLSILIRSFVIHRDRAFFHAGGGIVTDSDPEREYQETLDKIAGLRAALRECEQ